MLCHASGCLWAMSIIKQEAKLHNTCLTATKERTLVSAQNT